MVVGGVLLGGMVTLCMTPLVAFAFKGHLHSLIPIPFGVAAASLLASYMGGVDAILNGVLPTLVVVAILGG